MKRILLVVATSLLLSTFAMADGNQVRLIPVKHQNHRHHSKQHAHHAAKHHAHHRHQGSI